MTSLLHPRTPDPSLQSRFSLFSGYFGVEDSSTIMSGYGQQYRTDSLQDHHHQQQQHQHGQGGRPRQQSLPAFSPPSAVPSMDFQRPLPASTQSYPVPFYGPSQSSMTYPSQTPYVPSTQAYQSYQHGPSTGSPNYTYYSQPLPAYGTVPSQQVPFPDYEPLPQQTTPQQSSPQFLQPSEPSRRVSRSTSLASNASSMQYAPSENFSRSASPSATEMAHYGYRNDQGTWSCAFPGCTSKSTFQRGCDLRKHYRRHTKTLFCRQAGCPQATEGGFSSKKDRARHEAKHNPQITCEWPGCDRLFSRMDNMKDHVRRIHKRDAAKASCSS